MSDELELPEGTLDQILNSKDVKEEWVPIPEWNMKVKVKGLSKAEQIKARKMSTTAGKPDDSKLEGNILVLGMVSPKVTPDKVSALFEKSSGAVDKILTTILDLSNMTEKVNGDAEADFRD